MGLIDLILMRRGEEGVRKKRFQSVAQAIGSFGVAGIAFRDLCEG